MSIQGDREELATLLSTIDGVTGSKYRPMVIKTGSAWPLLDSLNRDNDRSLASMRGMAGNFQVVWSVVIVLPNDERKASEWFDSHHELIADVLEDFGYVTHIEPGLVAVEAGNSMQAMILTLRKEA